MMKLVSSPPSPFSRTARVAILETGHADTVEVVDVTTTPLDTDPAVRAANPLGKIPALIRDEGPAIYDSRVICRYLDARADAGLYPQSRLWDVLTLEATAQGMMEAGVLMVYETRFRPEEKIHTPWIDAQWEKIAQSLAVLNGRWLSHLNGPLDMSHIALGCALSYLDLRHDARGWRNGHDGLADWFASFAQRDSMIATAPG